MRLFIAIPLPPDIVHTISDARQKLVHAKGDIRWVDPKHFHITVKFLGETEETLLGEIASRISTATGQVPQFPLELEGFDRFPERGSPRAIISRVLSPDQRLTKLHRLIDSALGGIGLPMDTRVLVPHLTLGRVSSNRGLNRLLRLLQKHDLDYFGSFSVTHVTLMQSTLTPEGPQYISLHRADLAAPAVKP